MKKSIETDGKNYTIRTVNGVNTTTGAVWVKEIKVFEPLPNGFNLALANEVYAHIEANPLLWDQNSWRRLLDATEITSEGMDPKELASLLAYEQDLDAPACGTAMCFAGWASELAGADWVADGTTLRQRRNLGMIEYVLVPLDVANKVTLEHPDNELWLREIKDGLSEEAYSHVVSRGFSDKTHCLTNVEGYALMQLGLGSDWLDMFGGYNDLEKIRVCIDTYAQWGPVKNSDLGDYFNDEGPRSVPTERDVQRYLEMAEEF